jgi:hypothetical protein
MERPLSGPKNEMGAFGGSRHRRRLIDLTAHDWNSPKRWSTTDSAARHCHLKRRRRECQHTLRQTGVRRGTVLCDRPHRHPAGRFCLVLPPTPCAAKWPRQRDLHVAVRGRIDLSDRRTTTRFPAVPSITLAKMSGMPDLHGFGALFDREIEICIALAPNCGSAGRLRSGEYHWFLKTTVNQRCQLAARVLRGRR